MKKVLLLMLLAFSVYLLGCSPAVSLSDKEKDAFDACTTDVEENNLNTANIDFEDPEISTKDYCYNRVAYQTKNPAICKNIGHYELKDDCVYRYAVSTKNVSVCEMINIGQIKSNCQVMASPTLIVKSGYAE